MLPQEQIRYLTEEHSITVKDARTLVLLDDGQRLDYLEDILSRMARDAGPRSGRGLFISNWYDCTQCAFECKLIEIGFYMNSEVS